jgi:hypothetical protein
MGTYRAIRFHRAAALEFYAIDRGLIGALVARVERRVALSLSLGDRDLFASIGTDTLTGTWCGSAFDQTHCSGSCEL